MNIPLVGAFAVFSDALFYDFILECLTRRPLAGCRPFRRINILWSVLLLKYDPKSVIMGYNSKYAANALALVTKAAIALECRVAMQTLLITFINLPNADQIYFVHRLQWRSGSTRHQFQLWPLQVDAGRDNLHLVHAFLGKRKRFRLMRDGKVESHSSSVLLFKRAWHSLTHIASDKCSN